MPNRGTRAEGVGKSDSAEGIRENWALLTAFINMKEVGIRGFVEYDVTQLYASGRRPPLVARPLISKLASYFSAPCVIITHVSEYPNIRNMRKISPLKTKGGNGIRSLV